MMMKKSVWTVMSGVVLLGGLLMVGSPARAQGEGAAKPRLASVNLGANGAEWIANGSYASMTLTVSGPGGAIYRQEFEAGKAPTFGLFDKKGQHLPDGAYRWELVAAPHISADTRAAMRAARRDNNDAAIADLRKAGRIPSSPLVQSGSFAIVNGGIAEPDAVERAPQAKKSPATGNLPLKDLVTPDDTIIQGSLCVGLDCVNNESFGFDTIRLKENSTRIKFEDTSVGAFPSNDWQLTANDSASGGANKFSIEDITGAKVPFTVTGGAATNSIFVDSTGRVGFRTATPVLDLHVSTSNTPAIRLEQNNSGGFTAQTWDIGANEANFFVRDVTGGSRLSFRVRPGAPTSSIDISADGDVGIGTASPTEKLHVLANENANTFLLVENPNTGTTAAAVVRAQTDTAQVNFQAHASTRTISRFGKTLGGWAEMLGVLGNGLIVGTNTATPLVLGTNATNRLEIGGTGGVTVTGNFTVTGGTKNFAVVDPADSKRAIYFAALEGPEAGTYFRGSAKLVNGEITIDLPDYFSKVTENERMTVQLTPVGTWGQLYVSEKTSTHLVVKAAPGTEDIDFDFLVQGVRKGYLDFEVDRPNTLPRQAQQR